MRPGERCRRARLFLRARLTGGANWPAKQEAEFAPRKAYRECLNRNFAFLLIHERGARTPGTIADDALLAYCTKEKAPAPIRGRTYAIVKDRMKAWLESGGHVPENLW